MNSVLPVANLTSADLRGANLSGATLAGADLCWANLTDADLSWANLARASLNGASLTRADLTGASFAGATLTGVNLRGAKLAGADLTDTDLFLANPEEAATLEGTIFARADGLTPVQRKACEAKGAIFEAANRRRVLARPSLRVPRPFSGKSRSRPMAAPRPAGSWLAAS